MITLITIGQTPREDLLKPFHSEGIRDFNLIGALDELSPEEIELLEKEEGAEKLYVVLKNGTVNINHEIIEEKVKELIKKHDHTTKNIAVLCMSEFSCSSVLAEIIYPINELRKNAENIKSEDKTVIFVPIKEQLQTAEEKWSKVLGEKHFVAVQPKSEKVLDEINATLEQHHPNYVIMDCYGYDYDLVVKIENKYDCICYNAQHLMMKKVKEVEQ